eukprot:gene3594-3859_t
MPTTAITHGSATVHSRTVIGCLCSGIDATSRYHGQRGVPHRPHGHVTPAQQLSEVGIKVVYPYPPGQLPAGSSVQTLLGEQQALLPAAPQPSVPGRGQELRGAAGGKQSQHWQHTVQQAVKGSGTATSNQLRLQDSQQQQLLTSVTAQLPAPNRDWAGHLQQRPLHGPSDVMKLLQLLQNSSTLPQLQAVVDVHLQRMPPLALTVAMQQVQHIKQHQRAQTQLHQQQRDVFSQHSERQLAEQLSRALLACLPQLCSLAGEQLHQFSPRDCVLLSWGLAKQHHLQPRLFHAVQQQLSQYSLQQLSPDSIAQLLWCCARLSHHHPGWVSALVLTATRNMERFSPRALSIMLWACAKLRHYEPHLLSAVRVQALANMAGFEPQCLSMFSWALARLGVRDDQLLEAVVQRAMQVVDGFTMQGLANSLASSAASLSPLDLAQAVWGLEVLGYRRRAQQQRLVQAGLNSLHLFGAQALSNWCWAIAASGMAAPQGLPAAVARQVEVLLPQFSPQGLATTLWALSKLGHGAPQLLHAAGPVILAGITSYNAQDLCNIAMACCKAHHREPILVGGLAQAAAAAAALTLAAYSGGGVATAGLLLPASGTSSTGGSSSWSPGPSGAPAQPAAPAAGGLSRLAGRQVPPLQLPASGRAAAPASLSPAYATLWQAQQAKQITRQGVCNLVWAFSGLGWYDEALIQQLQQLAALSIQQGKLRKAQHVAGLLQGFARLSEPLPVLLDAMLEGSGARRSRASSSSKSGNRGKTMCRKKPTTNTSSVQDNQLSLVGEHDDLTEIGAWNRVLAQWPEDALALVVWAAAATGAHLTHASCLAAAVRLLRHHGVSPLSPQRCEQLHLALLLLATEWGLLGWADAGPKQERLHHSGSSSCNAGQSGGSSICSSPAGGQIYSRSRGTSTSSARHPQHHDTLQHAIIALLQELAARRSPSGGHHQAPSAAVSRAQEEVLYELGALRLRPLVDHWLSPGPPHAASQGAGPFVTSAAGTAVGSAESVQAVAAAAAGLAPGPEARLGLPCSSSSPWLYGDLADSLHVRLGVQGGWLGEVRRRPVALELLPPASLTSSWPRRVLGATGLHHDCLRAAGWHVVLLPLEDWEASMLTGYQQQLLKQLLEI